MRRNYPQRGVGTERVIFKFQKKKGEIGLAPTVRVRDQLLYGGKVFDVS